MADGFQVSAGQEDGEFDGRRFQVSVGQGGWRI